MIPDFINDTILIKVKLINRLYLFFFKIKSLKIK